MYDNWHQLCPTYGCKCNRFYSFYQLFVCVPFGFGETQSHVLLSKWIWKLNVIILVAARGSLTLDNRITHFRTGKQLHFFISFCCLFAHTMTRLLHFQFDNKITIATKCESRRTKDEYKRQSSSFTYSSFSNSFVVLNKLFQSSWANENYR